MPLGAKQAPTNTGTDAGMAGSKRVMVGEEHYLWMMVGLEVAALLVLRHLFRRSHGG